MCEIGEGALQFQDGWGGTWNESEQGKGALGGKVGRMEKEGSPGNKGRGG